MINGRRFCVLVALSLVAPCLNLHGGELDVSIVRIRADIKYLASDELQGRGIGTRGEDLAVEHIAEQFKKANLKPAGDRGTFFQAVPLVMVTTGPKATLAVVKGDEVTPFKLEDEFAGVSKTQQSEAFEAEAIFLGHGITAPEFGWDDYQGVDVKGKVVVVFTNEPPSEDPKFFGGKALTYYGRWSYKYEEAARRGAKAVLIIHTNETAGYPYSVVKKLKGAQIQRAAGAPALAFAGWLSTRAGDKLLAHAGLTVDEALKKADTRGFKAIPLGVRIKGHIPTTVQKFTTRNVVGIVEGSDPTLKSESVIFTAHWDHLGVVKSGLAADDIHNGALDNATGCAILLEMARLWGAQKSRPKRSAIFLATTAEESGLLGAVYYASHPAIPLGKTAINLNFDTVLPLGVPQSVVVSGAERTTAWPLVQQIAKKHDLAIEPDKNAHLGFFYRSDHFALARGGVPAFSVFPGEKIKGKPADFAKKAMEHYIAKVYHTPFDEFKEDWDLSGYPTIMRFAFDVAMESANAKALPTWAPSDEFRKARDASQAAGKLRAFYTGHSFHMFVPARMALYAKAGSVKEYQPAGQQGLGGSRVQQIWDLAAEKNQARKILENGGADVFTMSPNVKMPDDGIDKFVELGLKHNPTMRFFIQESWVPGDFLDKRITNNSQRDETDLVKLRADQAKWRRQMEAQAKALNQKAGRDAVLVMPVGDAVVKLRELVAAGKVPGFAKQSELFTDTTGHGKAPIIILTAYCNYACITGRSPVGLKAPEPAISDELNALLQRIAWETVSSYPMSGVKAPN